MALTMASWANAVQSPQPAEEFVRSEYHALSLTEVIAARAATVAILEPLVGKSAGAGSAPAR